MKKILKIEYDYNFELLASACSWPAYRFAWKYGYDSKIQFEKINPITIKLKKNARSIEFERYLYEDLDANFFVYIIQNKVQGEFLFKELKNFDYLIQLEGDVSSKEHLQLLSAINEVHLSVLVDLEILKKKEVLLS